jgi:hypothetical protein
VLPSMIVAANVYRHVSMCCRLNGKAMYAGHSTGSDSKDIETY